MSNNQPQKQSVQSLLKNYGLSQYTEVFIQEGFDRIEALMEITELDLIQMQVKRGHRRLLQKALSNIHNFSVFDPLNSHICSSGANHSSPPLSPLAALPQREHNHPSAGTMSAQSGMSSTEEEVVTSDNVHRLWKRKYHRHPILDKNAPHKPPSAYVMFSNDVRAELKDQNISFSTIAKIIGDRWKRISAEEKEMYETNAQKAREAYTKQIDEYQQTESFKRYQRYLSDFMAENEAADRPVGRPRKRQNKKNQTDNGNAGGPERQYPFYLLNTDDRKTNDTS